MIPKRQDLGWAFFRMHGTSIPPRHRWYFVWQYPSFLYLVWQTLETQPRRAMRHQLPLTKRCHWQNFYGWYLKLLKVLSSNCTSVLIKPNTKTMVSNIHLWSTIWTEFYKALVMGNLRSRDCSKREAYSITAQLNKRCFIVNSQFKIFNITNQFHFLP